MMEKLTTEMAIFVEVVGQYIIRNILILKYSFYQDLPLSQQICVLMCTCKL